MRRFRPNVVVDGAGELDLVGATLRLGTAVLSVAKGTDRCVLTRRGPTTQAWSVEDLYPRAGETMEAATRAVRNGCSWELHDPALPGVAPVFQLEELRALRDLDPQGAYWSREGGPPPDDEARNDIDRDPWHRQLPPEADAG